MDDKEMLEAMKDMQKRLKRLECKGYPVACYLCEQGSCIARAEHKDDIERWSKKNV